MQQKKSCKTYKVKTDRTERKNRQIHNFRWIFNISLSTIDKTTKQNNQQGYKTQQDHQPTGSSQNL